MSVTFLPSPKCFPLRPTPRGFLATVTWVRCHVLSSFAISRTNSVVVVAQQAPGGIVVPGSGRLVACLGVDDLVIVDVPDALMVTTRARAQEVKSLVASCRKAGFKNLM